MTLSTLLHLAAVRDDERVTILLPPEPMLRLHGISGSARLLHSPLDPEVLAGPKRPRPLAPAGAGSGKCVCAAPGSIIIGDVQQVPASFRPNQRNCWKQFLKSVHIVVINEMLRDLAPSSRLHIEYSIIYEMNH